MSSEDARPTEEVPPPTPSRDGKVEVTLEENPSPPPGAVVVEPEERKPHPQLWSIVATVVAVLALLLSFVSLGLAANAKSSVTDKVQEVSREDWRDWRDKRDYKEYQEWREYQKNWRAPCDCVPPPSDQRWFYHESPDVMPRGVPDDGAAQDS